MLFVAEKRAAIDAVLSRLKGVDLGEPVLDIHDGTRDRPRIARDLGETLDLAQRAAAPEDTGLHRRLLDRQRRLNEHAAALHEVHEPWGAHPVRGPVRAAWHTGAGTHPGPARRSRADHGRPRRPDPR